MNATCSWNSSGSQWFNQRSQQPWQLALGIAYVPPSIDEPAKIWHPSERPLWDHLKFERRRRQFLAGRLAGKAAAAQWLQTTDFTELAILKGPFEQPILQADARCIPEISIAHTDSVGIALTATPGYRIGIDLETFLPARRKNLESILQKTIGRPADNCYPAHCRDYAEWTAYESLSKALAIGLTYPFKQIQTRETACLATGVWRRLWRDFMQYQTLSFEFKTGVVSITLPADTNPLPNQDYAMLHSQIEHIFQGII